MARRRTSQKAAVPRESAPKKTVTVTYRPVEAGDPVFTTWNGIRFDANIPVELNPDNIKHQIEQLMPKVTVGPDGEERTKHVRKMMFMGDMARDNPCFEVDGKRARRVVSTRVVPPAGVAWNEAHEGEISYADEIDTSVRL